MALSNNSIGNLLGGLGASTLFLTIKDSKGDLFPSVYPYKLTIEEIVSEVVTKREIVTVTNKVGDTFTITRTSEACPASDSATTQTTTPQTFTDGALVQLRLTADEINDIKDDITDLGTDKLDISVYDQAKNAYASSSTGTDAYAITVTGISSYAGGPTYKIMADVANTGAATLNVNSLGVKTLKKVNSGAFTDLINNDIIANQIFWATYNSGEDCFQFSVDPAGVIDIPSATNTSEGIVELSTDAEAITKTDATRYTTPSQFDLMLNEGDYDAIYECSFLPSATGGIVGAHVSSNVTASGGLSSWSIAFSAAGYANSPLPGPIGGSNVYLIWSEISVIEISGKTYNSGIGASEFLNFGLGSNTDLNDETSIGKKIMISKGDGTALTLNTADGSNYSESASASVAESIRYEYKVIYTVGANAKLYINDVLIATKTTNLPSGVGNFFIGVGADNAGPTFISAGPIKVKIKYA